METFKFFKNLLFGSIGMIVFGGIALIVLGLLGSLIHEAVTPDIIRYADASISDTQRIAVCTEPASCRPAEIDESLLCVGTGLFDTSSIRDGTKVEVEDRIPDDWSQCVKIVVKEGWDEGKVGWVPYNRLSKER